MEAVPQLAGHVLTEMNKPFNKEKKYADQIKCFHDHGIMVNPGIIFGSDADDESVFENTVEFLVKNRVLHLGKPIPQALKNSFFCIVDISKVSINGQIDVNRRAGTKFVD